MFIDVKDKLGKRDVFFEAKKGSKEKVLKRIEKRLIFSSGVPHHLNITHVPSNAPLPDHLHHLPQWRTFLC